MKAVLVSTYEMGRQPFGVASPAAWLKAAGWDVACVDVSKEKLASAPLENADLVAFHLPMHTATRLAVPVITSVRALNTRARICAYGLYAPLNDAFLRSLGVDAVFGGSSKTNSRWASERQREPRPFEPRKVPRSSSNHF
jgi:hypothetical protein